MQFKYIMRLAIIMLLLILKVYYATIMLLLLEYQHLLGSEINSFVISLACKLLC